VSWAVLVGAAVVGTERRPPELAGDALVARALGDSAGVGDAPRALLDAAAVHALARAAAAPPATGALRKLPICAPDDAPRLPPAAVALLERLLDRPSARELLGQLLARAAARGAVVAPALVPVLLDAAADLDLRADALAVAGTRGAWLAALGDRWAGLAPAPPPAAQDAAARWSTGDREERAALLAAVREHDPAAGRALVEATWDEDPPADRAAWIAVLSGRPDPGDEPLLEAALDDRRKEVRVAAAAALAAQPASALVARMGARAAALVRPGRLRGVTIELPAAPDAAGVRDGLEAGTRAGARTRDLRLLAATAPLAAWTAGGAVAPGAVIAAALRGDHHEALLTGWTTAADRRRDAAWADALLHAGTPGAAPLLAVLEGEPRDAAGAAHVDVLGDAALPRIVGLPGPWGPATSKAVLDRLAVHVKRQGAWMPADALRAAGARLDLAAHDAARAVLAPLLEADARTAAADAARDLLDLLDLRHAIDRELPTP
jgi:hypothetical protein